MFLVFFTFLNPNATFYIYGLDSGDQGSALKLFTPAYIRYPMSGLWSRSRRLVSVSTSRSRDGLETYQRLVSVSSREKLSTSRSREADVSVSFRSRPCTYRARDQLRTITIDTELTRTAMVPVH